MSDKAGADIPDFISNNTHIYKDIHHYKTVYRNLIKALTDGDEQSFSSYLFDGIQVEFGDYDCEELYLDYLNSKIVLRVPQASEESKSEKRLYYISYLIRSVEAMKSVGINQIYLSLLPEGQDKVSNN